MHNQHQLGKVVGKWKAITQENVSKTCELSVVGIIYWSKNHLRDGWLITGGFVLCSNILQTYIRNLYLLGASELNVVPLIQIYESYPKHILKVRLRAFRGVVVFMLFLKNCGNADRVCVCV